VTLSVPAWPHLAALLALFIVSGGLWLVRNWWLFGSPLAPMGIQIAGITIFRGALYSEDLYHFSVLSDLRDPSYPLAANLVAMLKRWMGPWFLPFGTTLAALCIDALVCKARHGALSESLGRKLLFAGLFAVPLLLHAAMLVGAPWSSLEYSRGTSVRYLQPYFVLYAVGLYACLFTDAFPWHRGKAALPAGVVLAAVTLWHYVGHPETPGAFRREWFPLLEPRYIAAAGALVAGGFILRIRPARRGAWAVAGATSFILVVLFSNTAAARDVALKRASQLNMVQELACAREGFAESDHRGIFARVAAWQRSNHRTCGRTRYILTVRFDFPLALQESDYRNVVVDVERRSLREALVNTGASPTRCDVIIASSKGTDARGAGEMAVSFGVTELTLVARYGQYAAFSVP
jgi:hypothetical protein